MRTLQALYVSAAAILGAGGGVVLTPLVTAFVATHALGIAA